MTPARAPKPFVESLPLAPTVSAALNPAGADWEELSRTLTYGEVAARLQAADLSGLTETVWQGLISTRVPDTLCQPANSAPEIASRPPIASPSSSCCAQQHVPSVPRMRGRVPRSEETWQYVDGEYKLLGCLRAFRLIMWNMSGMVSASVRAQEAWNQRR